jgi:iron(III) transport system ATP-binding protein
MIKLVELTKVFDSRGIAGLHSINLHIAKGTILALMGPNGSGKSTLLKATMGELKLDSGKVEVEGLVHQFKLRPIPDEYNVQKYLISQITAVVEEEKKVQLTRDFADLFEFTFQLRQKGRELSQGQHQKVMLAAELINRPDVILLDEPFVHMDPLAREEILSSLFRYIREREITVIWVTHEREEAMRFADKMALLQHGHLEQVADVSEFMLRPKNLFVAQFMGHKNFLPIKKKQGQWQTPWGEIKSDLRGEEAVLVIPMSAWELEQTSLSITAKILSLTPHPFTWEVRVTWEDKHFFVWVGREFDATQKELKIAAKRELCFLIPL